LGGCNTKDAVPTESGEDPHGEQEQAIGTCNAASGLCWPYRGTASGYDTGITWNTTVKDKIEAAWNGYKAARLVSVPADPEKTAINAGTRLRLHSDPGDTVSEAMGYAMTFTSIFDEQSNFDALTRFVLDYLDEDGLMNWKIGNCATKCSPSGLGEAPDATDDMLYGWGLACRKVKAGAWPAGPAFNVPGPSGGTGKNYCDIAAIFAKRYKDSFIDQSGPTLDGSGDWNGGVQGTHGGNELMAGNRWCMDASQPSSDGDASACGERFPGGIVNPSYFDPGVFPLVDPTNATFWNTVATRNYTLINSAARPISGMGPQWIKYDGTCARVSWQGEGSCAWSYDGARLSFRLGRDHLWNNSANAKAALKKIGNFYASVMNNWEMGPCTTTDTCTSGGVFFAANAAVAIWSSHVNGGLTAVSGGSATGSLKRTAQGMFDYVLADPTSLTDYYQQAWRQLGLLFLSGNMPKPDASGGTTGGNTGTSNTPPVVSLTAPADNAQVTVATSVTVSATATDNEGLSKVEFYAGTTLIGSDTSSPYSINWTAPATAQSVVLKAVATDTDGATATSATKDISVVAASGGCSNATGSGTGLKGEYFANGTLNGTPSGTRTEAVNFDWGTGYPTSVGISSADNYSARWTGQVLAPLTGNYSFCTTTDDGARLWVNNQLIVDKWVQQAPTEWCGTISLTGGQKYDIKYEYYEGAGGAAAKLSWSSGTCLVKQIIPAAYLYTTASTSCTDATKNGSETDVDCGGTCSTKCAAGKACMAATDCSSGNCVGGLCQAASSCSDALKNGTESDVDCGGSCSTKCASGKMCKANTDCSTSTCVNGVCQAAATCTDGSLNGLETSVDCGGTTCPKCANSAVCKVNSDCSSNNCSGGVCAAAAATPCVPNVNIPGHMNYSLGTTNAVCIKAAPSTISGWGCSNMSGRTVKVNGVAKTCGSAVTKHTDGFYYFEISAGGYTYAYINSW
jgi:endo-1,4-beta-D-glucanase Y